jgi:hypothetical protein
MDEDYKSSGAICWAKGHHSVGSIYSVRTLKCQLFLAGRGNSKLVIDAAATSSKRYFFYHINLYVYIKFRIRILCVLLY